MWMAYIKFSWILWFMDQRSKISTCTTHAWSDSYLHHDDDVREMAMQWTTICIPDVEQQLVIYDTGFPWNIHVWVNIMALWRSRCIMALWGSRCPIRSSWSKGEDMHMSCLAGYWLTVQTCSHHDLV